MVTNDTINAAAKAYASKWDADIGTKRIIVEAYKKGAIDSFNLINKIINTMAKNNL